MFENIYYYILLEQQFEDEDVIRRYKRSISNFWNKYKNLADEWNLYYNGNDSSTIVAQQTSKDDIEILNENLYTLFRENL